MGLLSRFRKPKQKAQAEAKEPSETIRPKDPGQLDRLEADIKGLYKLITEVIGRHDQGMKQFIHQISTIQKSRRKETKAILVETIRQDLQNGLTKPEIVAKHKGKYSRASLYRIITEFKQLNGC